jgi:hypothetical protein
MKNKELNRWLAENVMNYHDNNGYKDGGYLWWFEEYMKAFPLIRQQEWTPTTNISQAFMCLEEILIRSWELRKTSGGEKIQYHCHYDYGKHTSEDTIEMAICMAAYCAKSGKSRFTLHSIK